MTSDPTRVLIVANQTATSPTLVAELQDRVRRSNVSLRLLVPALNRRLRHWMSDSDEAHLTALARAAHAQSVMADHGLTVEADAGDAVPLMAITDALMRCPADELIISTLPAGASHWLERGLIAEARMHFDVPVLHVVSAATMLTPPADHLSARELHALSA